MHGPNANSHRAGPAQQPNRTSPTARGGYATSQIPSRVRRKHGDQHRKRHERVVVRANQVHGSHLTHPVTTRNSRTALQLKINRLPAPAPILAGFERTVEHLFQGLNMGVDWSMTPT